MTTVGQVERPHTEPRRQAFLRSAQQDPRGDDAGIAGREDSAGLSGYLLILPNQEIQDNL